MGLHNRKSLEPFFKDSVDLYAHQVEGVNRMHRMRNMLQADDMGLGKTLQSLATFAAQCMVMAAKINAGTMEPRDPKMLVIAPVNLKTNWVEEIEKFTTFKHVTVGGTPTQRTEQLIEFADMSGPRVLIMNYEQVDKHLKFINSMLFDLAVFDEAHYIKGEKSKRTKACKSVISWRKMPMTGSPLLNRADELYPILDMIEPGSWGSYYQFRSRYCVLGGYEKKAIIGVKNEKELTTRLQNVMIRRLKKDVLDLPEVQIITRSVGLTPLQRKLYDEVKDDMRLETGHEDGPDDIENALTKFLRLKQICGTTASVLESGEDSSEKLDLAVSDAIEILENGHKIVVFTQFRSVQKAFMTRIEEASDGRFALYQLNGDTPTQSRQGLVHAWSDEPGAAVMCGMLQVVGVGLNMTASRHGMFLDKLFVPMLNQQAVDRMNRIGADETQAIQIFEYQVKGTIEARVEAILASKKELFDNVVEKDDWNSKLLKALQDAEEDIAA